jgi:branched-subunit amino acid aminotransferase/4-amino-4-deoxychorismate lyase
MPRQTTATGPEPLAYLNGQWLPLSRVAISALDAGFVQGVTVAEQLRTFGGRLFRLEEHLARLARSLEIIGVDPGLSLAELGNIAAELAAQNAKLLDPADDQNVTLFVTPGPYGAYAAVSPHAGPTVAVHTQPLPFGQWAAKYDRGESLIVSSVMQVPARCWPPELKCRSRMHYYLADREARQREAGARALLLDERGLVTEASTANVLVYRRGEGLLSPPKENILPGVTVAVVEELALAAGLPFVHRDLTVEDVATADEAFLCSTSPCLLAVTRFNGRPLGEGRPGPIAAQLWAAWNRLVGVDIVAQARRFATR